MVRSLDIPTTEQRLRAILAERFQVDPYSDAVQGVLEDVGLLQHNCTMTPAPYTGDSLLKTRACYSA